MALIICPECGEHISDKATTCIHCGFPISLYINYDPQNEEDYFVPHAPQRTERVSKRTNSNYNVKRNHQGKQKKETKFPYVKVALIWIVIIGVAINVMSLSNNSDSNSSNSSFDVIKETGSLNNTRAISIAEEIAERYLTWGSSIFNLSFSNAEVETDGYNHYIVSMQYHYENSKGEKRNKFATVFFTYFPETKTYESDIMCVKTDDTSAGAFGAKNTFKKNSSYGWGYEEGTNIEPTPFPQKEDTSIPQQQVEQSYENAYADALVEVSGIVRPSEYVIDGWELLLSEPVMVRDWDGNGQEYSVECSVLYFYYDDTIGGNSPSLFSGKNITVSAIPENYRGAGKYFLYLPTLVEVKETQIATITKANFENTVDLSPRDYNNSPLFEIYYNEQQSTSYWEYLGTTYASFSLPEYDFYSFDVFKMDSEYYLIPFNDYTAAPTIYKFIENDGLMLVWSYTV